MRTLSDTLLAAQKAAPPINALAKLILTYGEDSHTYSESQILDIKETGNGPLQSLVVILNNADKDLTGIDLQGFEGILSYGAGKEYSAIPPMKVISQEFDSTKDKLTCTLTLVGICNLMAEDKALGSYMPDEDDDKPVKTLVNQLIGGSLVGFTNCQSYGVVWEDGYDELANTFKPRDSFRVYEGNNRLSKLNQLLGYTRNVALPKADGKVHIFKPKTSGDYDYEYKLDDGQHHFFAKSLRNRLVIPNRILIRSYPDSDPFYEGEAIDTESYGKLPKFESHRMRLESNEQAEDIAEAKLAQVKMWCEAGSGAVPMNIAQEVYDYVRVVDSREKDERAGNIGRFTRHYNLTKSSKWGVSATWEMGFAFGDWQNVRKALDQLGITIDDVENYFSRFQAKDAYIENLLAKNMDFVWIDPESNMIDASKLTSAFIDNLPDGEYFYRARRMHLDGETGLTLWEGMKYYIRFSTDSDEAGIRRQDTAPSGVDAGEYWIDTSGAEPIIKRWTGSTWFTIEQWEIDALNEGLLTAHTKLASLSVDGLVLLDQVGIGDTYDLVYKSDISAHHILLSKTEKDGAWYQESGVGIDADKGIGLYGGEGLMGLRTYPTLADYLAGTNVQCYVGTDGKIYAGGGNVSLDDDGITIKGEALRFYYGATHKGSIYGTNTFFDIVAQGVSLGLHADNHVDIVSHGGHVFITASDYIVATGDMLPNTNSVYNLGSSAKQWKGGYFSDRLKIPVGTDLFD